MKKKKLTIADIHDEEGKKIPSKHAQYLRQYLKENYGIETEKELRDELAKLRKKWHSTLQV